MLVDSHCHLNSIDLAKTAYGSLEALVAATHKQGIGHMLCVNTELENFEALVAIADRCSGVSISVGVHPTYVVEADLEPTVSQLSALAGNQKCVAIGETGLDYYHKDTSPTLQKERFRVHIQAAKAVAKPLIIHTRSAPEDTLQLMTEEGAREVGGVMHCFTETWEVAKKALDLGFYISFSGILTFKNAESLRLVAKQVPLDQILIETDAPYLAPMPFRSKQNEPAYVRYVAEALAHLRGLSLDEIADITTQNFFRLFKAPWV